MTARFLAMLALALALCFPARPAAQSDTDVRLAADIDRSLRGYARLTIFDDVQAQVADGVVTLSGKVTMAVKREELSSRIGAVEGVRAVHNEIGVLPESTTDDELRKRIARAIYGSPAFRKYAAMANPPIHILVEHGHVTLSGVVPNDVDRTVARSLATGHGERSFACALRTDGQKH